MSELSRQKIESLLCAFHDFVQTSHSSADPQDVRVKQEWLALKAVMEKSPGEPEGHKKYVIELRDKLLKEEISRNPGNKGHRLAGNKAAAKIEINKQKLVALSKDLKRLVLRNTQDHLHL